MVFQYDFQVANRRVAGNRQQITFLDIVQSLAKPGRAAYFVVAADPAVFKEFSLLLEHVENVLMPLDLFSVLFRHAGFFHSRNGPFLRDEQAFVDHGMASFRGQTHHDGDLAVVDFSESPTPLPSDADTFRTLFW